MSSASCGCSLLNSSTIELSRAAPVGGRRTYRSAFSGVMRSYRPFCCGFPVQSVGQDAQGTHHADSIDKRASVVVANGTPLSLRIRIGSPYSLNSRVKTGLVSTELVESKPWQPNR